MSIRGLSCIFPVPDIRKTADYYVSMLGFRAVEYFDCTEPHICLYREGCEIILLQANRESVLPNRTLYGYGFNAYIYTDDQVFQLKGNKSFNALKYVNIYFHYQNTRKGDVKNYEQFLGL